MEIPSCIVFFTSLWSVLSSMVNASTVLSPTDMVKWLRVGCLLQPNSYITWLICVISVSIITAGGGIKMLIIASIISSSLNYLTGICRSVACSNIMGSMVITQINRKISVRFRHYAIVSYYIGHYHRSSLYPSASVSPPSPNLICSCYRHCRSSGNPGLHSSTTVMSKIGRVAIYWAMVLWRQVM